MWKRFFMLKRSLRMSIIIGGLIFGQIGIVYVQTATGRSGQTTTLIIEVNPTLTLIAPEPMSYTLMNPVGTGRESVALGQQVIVKGNYFNNTTDQPYLSVSVSETHPNVILKLTNIKVVTIGTVTANPTTSDITLSTTPEGYALPDIDQSAATGVVTGTHNLIIEKTDVIPMGSYSLGLIWTISDGG